MVNRQWRTVTAPLLHGQAARCCCSVGNTTVSALQVERLQSELAGARDSLRQAQQAERSAAAEGQRLREQAEELQAQGKALSEMQQQAQKYNAQLQEYNAKMQKELQVWRGGARGGVLGAGLLVQARLHVWWPELPICN